MEKDNNIVNLSNKRIVDRLDLQLLLAVIILFVSAWAYLNKTICEFTSTEPYNERMSYILVHYLLSLMLVLCIAITYIKGKYLLKNDKNDFSLRERLYIDLFIDSWLLLLILSFVIITFNNIIPWWIGAVSCGFVLGGYMIQKNFDKSEYMVIMCLYIFLFPLFITAMTNVSKQIDISVSYDKETENVSINVDAKSYDGRYILIGLADKELQKDRDYTVRGPVIRINKAFLHKNMVTISTVCPASGSERYKYSIRKILGIPGSIIIPENGSVYNKTAIMSIE